MTETITKTKSWSELDGYQSFKEELLNEGYEVKMDNAFRFFVCKKTETTTHCISLHMAGYKVNYHWQDSTTGEILEFEYNHVIKANENSLNQIKDLFKCVQQTSPNGLAWS